MTAGVMAALCALATSCASVGPAEIAPDIDSPLKAARVPVLPQERRDFAEALARYSQAVREEMHDRHAAAMSNYVAAAALDPSNESLQFRVALALLQEKRTAEAVAIMEKAAKAGPKSERVLVWLALVQRSAGLEDKALDTYAKAIAAAPRSAVAYLESSDLLVKQGKTPAAIRLLESAVDRVAPKEADDVMRKAGELYLREATAASQKGRRWQDLTRARKRMEGAVKRWPDEQGLMLMLGNLRALDNDIPGAIACYDELEKKNPDDVGIKEKLAISLMATGNKTGAVAALEGIAARQSTNAKVFYILAEIYEQLGETNRAILNYDIAGKNAPGDPLPFLKSSMLNAALGRHAEAEAVLRKGLAGAPDQLRLEEMLAYILMDQKKFDQSLQTFARVATKLGTPEGRVLTPNFRINYAIALQLGGRPAEAAGMLVEAAGTNQAAVDVFASYLMRDGTTNELTSAVEVLSRFEEKRASDPRAPMFRGLILSSLARHEEAVDAFARTQMLAEGGAQSAKTLTAGFYFWYAAACERSSNYARAAPLFLKSIALEPDNAEARNYLAYMWAERGERLDEALAQIRKALEAEPDNPAFRDTLGWIHFMKGDAEKALVETQRALKNEDAVDDPTINEHMGDILARLGRKNEAAACWRKAFICGNDSKQLPGKLRAAGIDPASLEKEAAEFKARKAADAPKKPAK